MITTISLLFSKRKHMIFTTTNNTQQRCFSLAIYAVAPLDTMQKHQCFFALRFKQKHIKSYSAWCDRFTYSIWARHHRLQYLITVAVDSIISTDRYRLHGGAILGEMLK